MQNPVCVTVGGKENSGDRWSFGACFIVPTSSARSTTQLEKSQSQCPGAYASIKFTNAFQTHTPGVSQVHYVFPDGTNKAHTCKFAVITQVRIITRVMPVHPAFSPSAGDARPPPSAQKESVCPEIVSDDEFKPDAATAMLAGSPRHTYLVR